MINEAGWESHNVYDPRLGSFQQYWIKGRALESEEQARVERMLICGLPWREAGPKDRLRLLWNRLRRRVASWGW